VSRVPHHRPPLLSLRQVAKSYGASVALQPTDLDIAAGEFVTLLGPSGCGKSTLLRIVCGVMSPSTGTISLDGRRIETLPPERRDIAMVFQTYALFPHMSVRRNLGFGLRMKGVVPAEQSRRVEHAAAICNLEGLLERMPRELSGGQQQRVALARALVMRPALLLLDEPLSNLDAKLRDSLRDELVKLHRSEGTTSLYVTHDQAEAMTMSDRVVVMERGRIIETGSPVQLYRQPRQVFTAKFLGQTNLLRVAIAQGTALLPWGEHAPVDGLDDPAAAMATVSVRPEDLRLLPNPAGAGCISGVSFAGAAVHYTVWIGGTTLRASAPGSAALMAVGDRVSLATGVPLRALQDAASI
jgi:putative spermidine/putrescine transport system ATP-binding protein